MTLDFDILLIGISLLLKLTWGVTLPPALHKNFIQYDIVFLSVKILYFITQSDQLDLNT